MSTEDWRKQKRQNGGSIKTINGILYARIQYIDKTTGKRREKLRRADSRKDARKHIKEMRHEFETFGQETLQSDKMTFHQIAQTYQKINLVAAVYSDGKKVAGKRSLKPSLSALKPLVEHFGCKTIRNIKPSDLEAYKVKRLNEPVEIQVNVKVKNEDGKRKKYRFEKVTKSRPRKIASVNRELQLMRAIFNFAKGEDLIIKSPFETKNKVISASAEVERDRVMTFDEERQLLATCIGQKSHIKPLVITAVDTAMRRGELFKLQWKDVDLYNGTITVQATNAKTEKTRIVGITQRVKEELTELWNASPRDKSGLVFGITNSIKKAWKSACNQIGVSDLNFHDLRHTATTRLIRAGVPHSEVMKITGHTQLKTFLRYLNLTNESVTNSANLLSKYHSNQEIKMDELEMAASVN